MNRLAVGLYLGLLTVAMACGDEPVATERVGTTRQPLALEEEAKLLASDGVADDGFAGAVDISGDYLVVGAWGDDDNGTDSGSAYIYERDSSGTWVEEPKLTANDGAEYDYFGASVAISGNYAIVGSSWDDDSGAQSGSAYIFERNGSGDWVQADKLLASDGVADHRFGAAVSIDGDYTIVGVWRDDDGGENAGAAYIFERDSQGNWVEEPKLFASDPAANDEFGIAVGISGDYAIIGADADDDNGSLSGSAYIFERDSQGNWTEQAKLTASDGAVDDFFGYAVAISGDHAIVGAFGDDDNGSLSGSAYVFERDNQGTWSEVDKLTPADGALDDYFASAVSISGDLAVVASGWDDDNGADSGSAYVFERDSQGTWAQAQKLGGSDSAAGDEFGASVAVSDGYVVCGASEDDDNGDASGAAYVFEDGCYGQPDGAPCDDDVFCNGSDSCLAGVCTTHTGDPCDLNVGDADDDCSESCDEEANSCTAQDPDGSECEDGTFCNGTETCTAGVCGGSNGDPCPGPDDDVDCSETCDEQAGACSGSDPDGSTCAGGGTCLNGICPGQNGSACSDAAECLADFCTDGVCCLAADCSPFVCGGDGNCRDSCTSAADCQSGYTCTDGSCGQPTGEDEDDGCGCTTPGRRPSAPALPLALLGLVFLRRRRGA